MPAPVSRICLALCKAALTPSLDASAYRCAPFAKAACAPLSLSAALHSSHDGCYMGDRKSAQKQGGLKGCHAEMWPQDALANCACASDLLLHAGHVSAKSAGLCNRGPGRGRRQELLLQVAPSTSCSPMLPANASCLHKLHFSMLSDFSQIT